MGRRQARDAGAAFLTAQPFAAANQRDGEQSAEGDPHARSDQPLLDRIAHEKEAAERERDAADPHDPARAELLFEVRLRKGRQDGRNRGRGSTCPRRRRRACSGPGRDGRGLPRRHRSRGSAVSGWRFLSRRSGSLRRRWWSRVRCSLPGTGARDSFKRTQTGLEPANSGAVSSLRLQGSEAHFNRAHAVARADAQSNSHDDGDRESQTDQQAECN